MEELAVLWATLIALTCPPFVVWKQQEPVFAVPTPLCSMTRLCLVLRASLAALLHPYHLLGGLRLSLPAQTIHLFTALLGGLLVAWNAPRMPAWSLLLSLFLPFAEVPYLSCSFPEPLCLPAQFQVIPLRQAPR